MATTMRFRKASDKDFVVIPEAGRVTAGMVLEGRRWKKYVALGLLEELPHDNAFTRPSPLKDEDFYIPEKAPMPPPEPEPEVEETPPTAEEPPEEAPEDDATDEPAPSDSGKMKKRAAARRKR